MTAAAATEPNREPASTPVVRFRNPDEGEVVINDLVQGRIVCKTANWTT